MALLISAGCSSAKKAQKRSTTPTPAKEKEAVPHVYNPASGKYEPVEDPKRLVDTIRFHEDKSTKPIETVEMKSVKKAVYDVAFLIPFNAARYTSSSGHTDPKVRRFIHYYAGVKMALHELAVDGIRISASILDTRESADEARRLIQGLKSVDAIVGPYETEGLRDAAEYSTRKKVPVFSPWTPSIPIEFNSPYFVQLTPGLEAHAVAMVEYIDRQLAGSKVYMVARNDPREKNRLNLFRDAHQRFDPLRPYEELIIDDASVSLHSTVLRPLIAQGRSTVFIMPFYSRGDEDFVNAFLRKLHAEKGTSSVYVFGMPQWLTFNRLNPDYLESGNVHVSTVHFMDPGDPEVQEFQRRFLERYGSLPEPAAHEGYSFTLFLGNSLSNYGTGFLDVVSDPLRYTDNSDFALTPVYRSVTPEARNIPNYLENQAIHILQFKDHAYRPTGE
jgi:ABC-type branched-subunit amino acid transport system substrate-binding protein